ncbi:MAG TPA: hypothetical protein VGN34_25890 [Ktedonobacteraceae bacterium]
MASSAIPTSVFGRDSRWGRGRHSVPSWRPYQGLGSHFQGCANVWAE